MTGPTVGVPVVETVTVARRGMGMKHPEG
jgi:hypothetical protein